VNKAISNSPLRDIELKEYEIQGFKFRQKKPCFDYRIRIERKKFNDRYNRHQNNLLKDTINEITCKTEQLKEVFNYIGKDEIEKLFSANNTETGKKLEKLSSEKPELYFEFMKLLSSVTENVYSAMQLFVMDRENLKDLFEIMLDGDISVLNFNPESEEEQAELDNAGITILNDFFLSKNLLMN
jgi:hypothetical protein